MMATPAGFARKAVTALDMDRTGSFRSRKGSTDETGLSTAVPSPALTCASWAESPAWLPLQEPLKELPFPKTFGFARSESYSAFVFSSSEEFNKTIFDFLAADGSSSGGESTPPPVPLLPPGLMSGTDSMSATITPPGLEVETKKSPLPPGTTTAMLRNIPNKYTQEALYQRLLSGGYGHCVDFLYVPIDFKNRCNFGYAFINFRSVEACDRFAVEFHGSESRVMLPGFQSRKICEVSPARHQGLDENVRRLRDSAVMTELAGLNKPEWMPQIFGANGEVVPFPMPAPTPAATTTYASDYTQNRFNSKNSSNSYSSNRNGNSSNNYSNNSSGGKNQGGKGARRGSKNSTCSSGSNNNNNNNSYNSSKGSGKGSHKGSGKGFAAGRY